MSFSLFVPAEAVPLIGTRIADDNYDTLVSKLSDNTMLVAYYIDRYGCRIAVHVQSKSEFNVIKVNGLAHKITQLSYYVVPLNQPVRSIS